MVQLVRKPKASDNKNCRTPPPYPQKLVTGGHHHQFCPVQPQRICVTLILRSALLASRIASLDFIDYRSRSSSLKMLWSRQHFCRIKLSCFRNSCAHWLMSRAEFMTWLGKDRWHDVTGRSRKTPWFIWMSSKLFRPGCFTSWILFGPVCFMSFSP